MVVTRSFTSSQLREVLPGMLLVGPVARAARVTILVGALEGRTITSAGHYGAGFRDLNCQRLFYAASHGDVRAITALRLLGTVIDPHLHTAIAAPGSSSHGDSTRADFIINGDGPTSADLAFMADHEWRQEFGAADRHHFQFFGSMTGAVRNVDKNRIVAHWLNKQHLGKQTATEQDGAWAPRSNFSWLLQTRGNEDGLYPTSKYHLDGVAGARTEWLRDHYAEQIIGY